MAKAKQIMRRHLFIVLLYLFSGAVLAQELPIIDIKRGTVERTPVAILDLYGEGPRSGSLGVDIARLIRTNLKKSGLFAPINPKIFPQEPNIITQNFDAELWKPTRAKLVIYGTVTLNGGQMQVTIHTWDMVNNKAWDDLTYGADAGGWRRIAHIASDALYERISGEPPMFDSRIVYVAETGDALNRVKRLAVMDSDGGNHQYLTSGDYLVLTPRFAPDRQVVSYLSYLNPEKPQIYIYNLDTGTQELLMDVPGIAFAPRFSPDGKKIIFSQAISGNTDIYVMDLGTRDRTRLTQHPAIDTSPSFSPDGKKIVFNSDRGGAQQLYVMDADGDNVERISFGDDQKGRYATPTWSPNGNLIAFTRILASDFALGVMNVDGTEERIFATDFLIEGPEWSPNGRMLVYYRQPPTKADGTDGIPKLYMINTVDYQESELVTPIGASDPTWSPVLPK